MSMQHVDEDGVMVVDSPTFEDSASVAILARSEIASQLDAAHRYPRATKRFLDDAITIATLNKEIAQSCIYAVPRAGKTISGPSVRLAEICASAYGNLHVASRVVDVTDKEIVAQGAAWDLEKNLRVTVEARRSILDKNGRRFKDDMITVTGAAAGSIALRNAIFRVVPRAYVDAIYAEVRNVAVGSQKTLGENRSQWIAFFMKMGIAKDRILARVDKPSVEDVGLEELEVLVGLASNIRSKQMTPDDAFPAVDQTQSKSRDLEAALGVAPKAPPAKKSEPKPQPVTLAMQEVDPLTGEIVPDDVGR